MIIRTSVIGLIRVVAWSAFESSSVEVTFKLSVPHEDHLQLLNQAPFDTNPPFYEPDTQLD